MSKTYITGDYVQGDKIRDQYKAKTINITIGNILMQAAGPTLGRMILTTLLGGRPEAGDIAETLTDSLAKLTDDYKARRNGERLFEEIGENAAEKLATLFAMEGEGIAPAQQEVIAHAVGQTLEQQALRLLIGNGLQKEPFERALCQLEPPATFHAEDKQLFQRALAETSNTIFFMAAQLPHFQRETAAQLLQNTNDLRQQMADVLDKLTQIYQTSQQQNPEHKNARFEQQYRQLLSHTLDRIKLFGLPQGDHSRQPLSIAFVPLRGIPCKKKHPQQVDSPSSKPEQNVPSTTTGARLLIVGSAGAGKTTLLKWLAVRAANQDQVPPIAEPEEGAEPTPPPLWHNKIPFLIRLRDFAHGTLPTLRQLPLAYPGLEALGEVDEDWVRTRLTSGQGLVLVDGLDEVTKERRQATYEWLNGFIELYPQATYLVTTRPSTLSEAQTKSEFERHDFHCSDLQPLDDKAVEQFVAQWHNAMGHKESLLPQEEKARLPERANVMRREFRRQPILRHLAKTPLLCAMLCALNLAREGLLPLDRIQLYEACLAMLLEGRDKERKVDLADYGSATQLNLREKLHLMGQIAYWMMDNDLSIIHRLEAEEKISHVHSEPQLVWRFLVERSGLLQSETVDEFNFAHRTFQEYLAAKHIAFSNNVRAVCQRAEKPEWRETILLTAGVLNDHDKQAQLLKGLSIHAKKQTRPRSIHILALECLSLMPVPSQQLVALTVSHLEALVQERHKEGERQLSLDLSTTTIVNFSLLASLTNLQSLVLTSTAISDLTPLASLTNLQSLELNSTAVRDLTPLASLTNLQSLELNSTAVSDLTPLASLTNLQSLELNSTAVSDLTPLASLTNLQSLELRDIPAISFGSLVKNINLKILWVTSSKSLPRELINRHGLTVNPVISGGRPRGYDFT